MEKLASWLPKPGYTIAAGVCLGLAVIAGLGTSWQDTLYWSLAAVTVAGAGIVRRRKTRTQGSR